MQMISGSGLFKMKVALAMLLIIGCLVLIGISFDANTGRFGGWGAVPWIIGIFVFVAGVIVAWATAITWLDRRSLRAYRASPRDRFEDGQVVALSGHIRLEGDALEAPFSGKACAAYSFEVKGERRHVGHDNSKRGQLCLLSFAMASCVLESDGYRFPLAALPNVDTDELRSIASGGEWGERGLAMIQSATNSWPAMGEVVARGQLEDARITISTPQRVECFVAPTEWGAGTISVTEDHVPVDKPVTVLATYQSPQGGLDGRRLGGMKIFPGNIDASLAALDNEWRHGLKIGLPLLAVGYGLLTLAQWLP